MKPREIGHDLVMISAQGKKEKGNDKERNSDLMIDDLFFIILYKIKK